METVGITNLLLHKSCISPKEHIPYDYIWPFPYFALHGMKTAGIDKIVTKCLFCTLMKNLQQ